MNELPAPVSGWKLAGAIVGGLLVVGVVGAFAWLALDTPPAASGPAQAGGLRGFWEQSIAPMPPAVSEVADVAVAPAASAALPPGRLEVCGLGVVSEIDWMRRVRQQSAAIEDANARQKIVEAFLADPDELTRAVALVLQSSGGPVVADEDVTCEGVDCPAVPEKIESGAARQRRIAANTGPRDKLARMALASRSPELYGLAWQVCRAQGSHDEPSACRLLSSDQWARLEPHNAVPWFEVANQARQRGDRAAVAEALYRVSLATTSNARVGRLNERMLSRLPPGVTLLNAMAVGTEMVGIERAWPPLTGTVLNDHCSAAAVRDANRHQRCNAVAEVLVQHGTATTEVLDGIRLGERLGWPEARIAALRTEMDALLQASVAQLPERSLSCTAIARYLKHLQDVGQHGDLMAGRRTLDASGRSIAEWAQDKAAAQARAEPAASAVAVNR